MFVRDLEIVASVGILEREKRYEQRIIVSAERESGFATTTRR